ncbi:GP63-like protein leishmanolysin-like protein metallo-peptidase Clan MA(M) Family M8 [Leptomonas seymouri]|uniref:Leishmanolysin n=1 Tax=Leptomonas seymouri TaxID=5684 RepID=A0A0N1IL11_LEPSE|nr:GP63-like protein leishmanolysin-like protein metallo-peptidase Clan MA(M) Family M8 [Leptomonas seymouri]|eukprot:KPI87511.1 GP63-like protein leishmanolysin-like protein metallo-peptidase Clan MA(M) Family M8 [Leptomonas seymouri]
MVNLSSCPCLRVVVMYTVVLCFSTFITDVAAVRNVPHPVEPSLVECVHDHLAAEQEGEPLTYVSFGKAKVPSAETADSTLLTAPSDGIPLPVQHRIVEMQAVDSVSNPSASTWAPIRIAVFTPDLEDSTRYCTAVGQHRPDYYGNSIECTSAEDILTDRKKRVLMDYLLPEAVKAHASRLMVHPVAHDTTIVVKPMRGRYCGSFTVPDAHKTEGVADADFVVYAAAGPTSTPKSFIAWALTCQWFANEVRHPAVGVIYFNPRYLPETIDETLEEVALHGGDAFGSSDRLRRSAAHELLHALGFTYRVFKARGVFATVPSLRGKTNVPVLNGTAVRAAAKAHYGLSDSDLFYGLELEDEGAAGTTLSHWKRRSAKDELMAAVLNVARYSRLSIAAMEDLGFYKGNYENIEHLAYGYDSGIVMFNEKCVMEGKSNVPSVFCGTSSSSVRACTTDRLQVGHCHLTYFSSPLPSNEQYFANSPKMGGALPYMDYCPVIQGLGNAACNSGSLKVIPGSVISSSSRCFDTSNLIVRANYVTVNAICAQVHCDNKTRTYEVLVSGATSWLYCGSGGHGRTVFPANSGGNDFVSGGKIACPRYEEVCYANPDAFDGKSAASTTLTTTTTTTTTPMNNGTHRLAVCVWTVAGVLLALFATTANL